MHDRSKRIRQLEERLRTPPMEAAQRSLARMVAELGPREVLVSGALKALLARYFRANRDTLGDLDSATLLDVLVLVMPLLGQEGEDVAAALEDLPSILSFVCPPPSGPMD